MASPSARIKIYLGLTAPDPVDILAKMMYYICTVQAGMPMAVKGDTHPPSCESVGALSFRKGLDG